MNISSKLSISFLGLIFFVAVFAPWVAPYSYETQDTLNALANPSLNHWMGTDRLGRDLFSRLIYGARVSLFIGIATTLLALLIGTIYGAVSGYAGGRTDSVMMRFVDVVFALPDLLMIILITVIMGRGVTGMFIALTLVSWVTVARLVRGEVLRIKEYTYIEAARALGAGDLRILIREILPNILGSPLILSVNRYELWKAPGRPTKLTESGESLSKILIGLSFKYAPLPITACTMSPLFSPVGINIAPAIGIPSRKTPIEHANILSPLEKFLVPSNGSITQTYLGIVLFVSV